MHAHAYHRTPEPWADAETPMTDDAQKPKPPQRSDISNHAVSLARMADRLKAGNYVIMLEKGPHGWRIDTATVTQSKETGNDGGQKDQS